MKLKVKPVHISTGGPLVCILNEKEASLMDLHKGDRIVISRGRKKAIALVDLTTSHKLIKSGKIGLFNEVVDELKAKNNNLVDIKFSHKPISVSFIRDKLNGEELSKDQIYTIIKDMVHNKLTEIELTAFVTGVYTNGMTLQENSYLTKAIRDTGSVMKFNQKKVVDLHCIGGIAGNRTTLLIVPILASLGLSIAKTSSRAITSPSGTSDTLELLCNVSLSLRKIKSVVKKTNACMVWGGAVNLAPADDKIISVEYPLSIDAPEQLVASILAKKLSLNPNYVLIDIPVGKNAKVKTRREAIRLKKRFKDVSRRLKLNIRVIITDGSQPIGKGIGVALEVRDVLRCLENHEKAPTDLMEKSIYLTAVMLKHFKKMHLAKAKKIVRQVLLSGKAKKKFFEIIKAQEGKEISSDDIKLGKFVHKIKAKKSGVIKEINNRFIAKLAKLAGAPRDKQAGVYLHNHCGDRVKKGDIIMEIYSDSKAKLTYSVDVHREIDGIVIKNSRK